MTPITERPHTPTLVAAQAHIDAANAAVRGARLADEAEQVAAAAAAKDELAEALVVLAGITTP